MKQILIVLAIAIVVVRDGDGFEHHHRHHRHHRVNFAVNAVNAVKAHNAINAKFAETATKVMKAENAGVAKYAKNAMNARNAENAGEAMNALNAKYAKYAYRAKYAYIAENATHISPTFPPRIAHMMGELKHQEEDGSLEEKIHAVVQEATEDEDFSAQRFTCHHWTAEDKRKKGSTDRVTEKKYCENTLGFKWTEGNDNLAPGCGSCWCCKPVEDFDVQPFTCHHWTAEDKRKKGSTDRVTEKKYCENTLGFKWTEGNDKLAPGCGSCWCCKPVEGKGTFEESLGKPSGTVGRRAHNAINAVKAVNAVRAKIARNAINAFAARNAGKAKLAKNALYAEYTKNAKSARNAKNARKAKNAKYAEWAMYAKFAQYAKYLATTKKPATTKKTTTKKATPAKPTTGQVEWNGGFDLPYRLGLRIPRVNGKW